MKLFEWLVETASGILTLEAIMLVALIFLVVYRLTSKKADKDLEVVSEFMDTIDKETLFNIAAMEERKEDYKYTIQHDIEMIDETQAMLKDGLVKNLLTKRCTVVTLIDHCLLHVSKAFIKIIVAVKAIEDRKNAKLQEENKDLNRRLVEATKLLDEVAIECVNIINGEIPETTIVSPGRQRILDTIEAIEKKKLDKRRRDE